MSEGASQIIIPGARPPAPAGDSATPAIVWIVAIGAVVLVLCMVVRGRRRSIDPGELVFRRLAAGLDLKRSEIRSIRRAAAAHGSRSPAAIAMSPELTEQALRDHTKPRRRAPRTLAVA